jgi:F-type H+-transporting ATPase subunit epsilon
MVVARTVDGELGILPGHTPLLGVLVEGEVRIKSGEGSQSATIDSGFLAVDREKGIIVSESVVASQFTA